MFSAHQCHILLQAQEDKYDPLSNFNYTTIDCVFKIKVAELWEKYVDPQSCTSSPREEYTVCEYINGYRLMANVLWCLYAYDSYNSIIHDVYVKIEVEKFAEVIPSFLLNIDFYKKKVDID
ncbi:hypothetical protein FXO38_10202, partial [Capsicum annuum]